MICRANCADWQRSACNEYLTWAHSRSSPMIRRHPDLRLATLNEIVITQHFGLGNGGLYGRSPISTGPSGGLFPSPLAGRCRVAGARDSAVGTHLNQL